MLLLMIERDMPIDVVLFADTGMEFPEMYAHLEKLDAYLSGRAVLRYGFWGAGSGVSL